MVGIVYSLSLYRLFRGVRWTKRQFIRRVLSCWAAVAILLWLLRLNNTKVVLDADDLYGTYQIDKSAWPGRQADWQYDHYVLIIRRDGTMKLTERYDGGGARTFTIPFRLKEGYANAPRLLSQPDTFTHHILQYNPTLYREYWGFHYAFYSPRYGEVFFRKRRWWEP
ncbi:hypothetical protein, partial [Neolewinella sp.]|uniref:hypothetical protein n=1 Tax=Neolewinella sp. TaxID=2993543 RepID=UPI003B51B2EB